MSTATQKNKVKFRLKCAYYAPITENEADGIIIDSYGTPVRLRGAVSTNLSPSGELTKFHADAMLYYAGNGNNGYSGNLDFALLDDDFRAYALGERIDETTGLLVETSNDEPRPFALLFEFEGDKKGIRHVMYKCFASRPSIEGENGETKEPKAESITITAVPREKDNMVKTKTTATTPAETYNQFYTKVCEPSEVTE